MTTTTEFTFTRTPDGAYQVRDRDGLLLGTVRKGGLGGWYCTAAGDSAQNPGDSPSRLRAAQRLVGIAQSRAAHEADNRPAPIPDGFELVALADLQPGDVIRCSRESTRAGVTRSWSVHERVVERVHRFEHGQCAVIWFEPPTPPGHDRHLLYPARLGIVRRTTEPEGA